MGTNAILSKTSFPIFNGYAPAGGPKAIPIKLDFTTESEIEFNVIDEIQRGVTEFIQSVWVDNRLNAAALLLRFSQTDQVLEVPAEVQGVWPVIAPAGLRCTASTTPGAGILIQLILLNVPMPMTQYGPVTVNANVTADATPIRLNVTTRTLTLAGASEELLAANAARRRVVINASANNAGPATINYAAAAVLNQGLTLGPGERWDSGTGPVSAQQIRIIGTAGDVVNTQES